MGSTRNFLIHQHKENNTNISRAQVSKSVVDRSFYNANQEDKGVSPSIAQQGEEKVKFKKINTNFETMCRLKKSE